MLRDSTNVMQATLKSEGKERYDMISETHKG